MKSKQINQNNHNNNKDEEKLACNQFDQPNREKRETYAIQQIHCMRIKLPVDRNHI